MTSRIQHKSAVQQFMRGGAHGDHARGFGGNIRGGDLRLARAVRYVEKQLECEAQHGPVRILFKDGKPVPQEQQNG